MIQASEVRIGNCTEQGKIIELKQTVFRVEYTTDKKRTALIAYEDLKPTELTEEILLKCGFKHLGNGFYELLGSFVSLCNIGDVFFNAGFKGATIGNIKYLHQLQNLYFTLTGKELEINL
ncbi:hypothetical protein [Myroides odoratus]|uniref:hypothetical protein n=1 Tax=Myroides odoratus TaxID=256 RepID=UPI0039AF5433